MKEEKKRMKTKRSWAPVVAATLSVFFLAAGEGGNVAGKVTGYRKLKDFVVYVYGLSGNFPPPAAHAVMDQKGMEFIPHVLPVVKGSTVDFLNSDKVAHNVFSPDFEKFNLGTWPQGEVKAYTFDKTLGAYTMLCNVHPEMEAFIVVLENPYFAVTDEKGDFVIHDLPDGTYTLKTWHQKYKPMTGTVSVSNGKAEPVTLHK